MSAYRFGLLRWPTFRMNKVMLPKHRNLSDSYDGSDKQDTYGSKQENCYYCDHGSDNQNTCRSKQYNCDSCDDGSDKQDTCGSKQDNCDSCDDGSDKQDSCGSKQDSSSTTEGQATSDSEYKNPSAPTAYDSRKYGHNLPMDSVMPSFETLPCIPTGIFRCTAGEVLGAGASKESQYKNPEYFSFHHMTFYDMHLVLRSYREECPDTCRKK